MTNISDAISTADTAESPAGLTPSAALPSFADDPSGGETAAALVLPHAVEPSAAPVDSFEFNVPAVQPSSCGCGRKKGAAPQLVYALGRLGYDYVSLARRDSIAQHMDPPANGVEPNPDDPLQLIRYLQENPWDAKALIWTLNIEDTPVYEIRPSGPYAEAAYDRLRDFLAGQVRGGVDRISVPGYLAGRTRLLMAHMEVPVLIPDIRDMYSWNTEALVTSTCGKEPTAKAEKEAYLKERSSVGDFLERVYHGFRNLGILPQDRAVNYAATNAFHISNVFELAIKSGRELDTFEVVPSPMCRPDSECWDVKLVFFDPAKQLERARRIYRFTVDVSDVVPVLVGSVRTWHIH